MLDIGTFRDHQSEVVPVSIVQAPPAGGNSVTLKIDEGFPVTSQSKTDFLSIGTPVPVFENRFTQDRGLEPKGNCPAICTRDSFVSGCFQVVIRSVEEKCVPVFPGGPVGCAIGPDQHTGVRRGARTG